MMFFGLSSGLWAKVHVSGLPRILHIIFLALVP